MQTDPVCRMQIEPKHESPRAEHKGTAYYFCSEGCRNKFVADPEKYASAGAPAAGHGAAHQHHG